MTWMPCNIRRVMKTWCSHAETDKSFPKPSSGLYVTTVLLACWLFGIARGCFCEPCRQRELRGERGVGRRWRGPGWNTDVASREGIWLVYSQGKVETEVKRSGRGSRVGFLVRGEGWGGVSQVLPADPGSSDALCSALVGKDGGRWRGSVQRRSRKSRWHIHIFCYIWFLMCRKEQRPCIVMYLYGGKGSMLVSFWGSFFVFFSQLISRKIDFTKR